MIIGLDMMGGDFAPQQAVLGLKKYLLYKPENVSVICIGKKEIIKDLLVKSEISLDSISIIDALQIIDMHEHPTKALKEKPESSIAIGFKMLAGGQLDAFISAGNTGAMLVGAMYSVKPVTGILRPAIGTIIPKLNGGKGILLDVGLNADCKGEHLNQFAVLGSLYAKKIIGIETPRVGLLNVGEEEGKGNLLAQSAFPLLKANDQILFAGNVEGRDIFMDKADVIVCEGFTGNIILKMAESIYNIAETRQIKDDYLDSFQYENYGGTPVLGIAKPVIIGHGISQGKAFFNMIQLAEKMVASHLCSDIAESFGSLGN